MKHAWLYSDLLQALNGERMSSGRSTDRSLISASAVPHWDVNRSPVSLADSPSGYTGDSWNVLIYIFPARSICLT